MWHSMPHDRTGVAAALVESYGAVGVAPMAAKAASLTTMRWSPTGLWQGVGCSGMPTAG